jgi:hypothetical protein
MNSKEILPGMIVVRLNAVGQLFNTMDPSPFHERDLDHDAEEFIVSSAREIHAEAPLRIRIELSEEPRPGSADMVRESLGNFFRYRRESARRELHELLREGRFTLVAALLFLGCMLALRSLLPEGPGWAALAREGLIIGGWVALWKPVDIHLYRWWPIRRQMALFQRLSECPVEVLKV